MYCEIVEEPKCLEYITTGVDLTHCLSYYDGCNTCSVVDGRVSACTLMYCENPGKAKCIEYAT